jgi:hypothetical protein
MAEEVKTKKSAGVKDESNPCMKMEQHMCKSTGISIS